ncbi:MAG TPA: M56 family metallopeptidase, partial [Polyangiales bacterium]|nr:M56 family metallopeptidase [Polyangiales bacterium]
MNPVLHVLGAPAQTIAMIAINAVWEDAGIVLAVAIVLRLWPCLNAATRYTVWFVALVAALATPVVTTLSTRAQLPLAVSHSIVIPSVGAQPRSRGTTATLRDSGYATARAVTKASPLASSKLRPQIPLSAAAAIGIASLWIVALLVGLVRLIGGLVRLERVKQNALPLPLQYREGLARHDASAHDREIRFCVSDQTEVPVAVGLFDSMVLIPRHLLESLSPSELEQVCLHECAHLRRADDWTNLLQRALVAVLSFSPAVYAIARGLDLEREVACDDDVVTKTGAVRPYAQCLTRMAEVTSWPHRALAAPGVFVTRRGISERIERLLHVGRNVTRGLALAPTAVTFVVVGALGLGMEAVAPTLGAPPAPV